MQRCRRWSGQQRTGESIISSALATFERSGGPGPYEVQYELQDTMQDLVGIRRQDEMEKALEKIQQLKARAETVSIRGNRDFASCTREFAEPADRR